MMLLVSYGTFLLCTVPYSPSSITSSSTLDLEPSVQAVMTRAQKKNSKKKLKRKDKKGHEDAFEIEEVTDSLEQLELAKSDVSKPSGKEVQATTSSKGASTPGDGASSRTKGVEKTTTLSGARVPSSPKAEPTEEGGRHVEGDLSADIQRKVRNLRKKLKQIEELEAKVASGEIRQPEQGQLDKISKKTELVREIEELMSAS